MRYLLLGAEAIGGFALLSRFRLGIQARLLGPLSFALQLLKQLALGAIFLTQ